MSTLLEVQRTPPREITVKRQAPVRLYTKQDYGPKGDPGPQGPAGPRGPGSAVIADTPTSVSRWSQRLINTLGSDDDYTASVDGNGALTISSPEGNTNGSNRLAMVLPEVHTDVEIHVLIQPPSPQTIAAKIPQVGIVLRVQDHDDGTTSAFVVDTNVAGNVYTTMWLALWQWPTALDSATPSIDTPGTVTLLEQRPTILSTQRASFGSMVDQFVVDQIPGGWSPTTTPTVIVDASDDQYDQAAATLISATRDRAITVASPAGADEAIALAPAAGTIRLPGVTGSIPIRAYYPLHVVARVVGTVAELRTWPAGAPDPGWGSSASIRHDFADSTLNVPTSGPVGLLANHVQGGKSVSYSDITVTDLDTGA